MGPRELLHRIHEQLVMRRLSLAWRFRRTAPGNLSRRDSGFCSATDSQTFALDVDFSAWRVSVDELLEGHWPALGFSWQWTANADTWRRAPDTGRDWPRTFFGDIPYRPGNPVGDVRVAWEPARLQQLVALALVARDHPEAQARRAVSLLERELSSWTGLNPWLTGIHYLSAMECGLRIIAVCHALDLVRGRLAYPEETWSALLQIVGSHAELIEQRLSLYSSAGNHTVAECAGLLYAGVLFPEFPRAGRWLETGLRLLNQEVDRQVLPDGGGLEQAFWYLLFISDLGQLSLKLLKRHAQPVPQPLEQACERASGFLEAISCDNGDLPRCGDSDDGYALIPGLRLSLSGDRKRTRQPQQTFADAGYTRLRGNGATRFDVLFDHGPLGMPPSCGHGHADALSVLLWLDQQEILVDSGTYSYYDLQRRSYYRSTAAHNTAVIDAQDQAVQETAFMWSAPYSATLEGQEANGNDFYLLGRHDGYWRRFGVIHWRGLCFRDEGLYVWDHFDGSGSHSVDIFWHSAVPVHLDGPAGTLADRLGLEIEGAQTVLCEFGRQARPAALRSIAYGKQQEIWTVTGSWSGTLPHTLVTTFVLPGRKILPAVAAACQARFQRMLRCSLSA